MPVGVETDSGSYLSILFIGYCVSFTYGRDKYYSTCHYVYRVIFFILVFARLRQKDIKYSERKETKLTIFLEYLYVNTKLLCYGKERIKKDKKNGKGIVVMYYVYIEETM